MTQGFQNSFKKARRGIGHGAERSLSLKYLCYFSLQFYHLLISIRWLLLNFKREFDYMEAIRLFEITSSRHLEVSSVEAELERGRERAKDFVKDSTFFHFRGAPQINLFFVIALESNLFKNVQENK